MKLKFLVLAAVAAGCLAGTAWAHHSHSSYDRSSFTHLEGKVTQLRWMNPHIWIYLEVMDAGEPGVWTLEGGSPRQAMNEGWTKEDVQVGETIKVRCSPLKDGSKGCLLGFVTTGKYNDKKFD